MNPLCRRITRVLTAMATVAAIAIAEDASAQGRRMVTLQTTHTSNSNIQSIEAFTCESVDIMPQFPGGDNAMIRYINSERRYPSEAYRAGIAGRVLCSFIVEPDGRLSNIEVVRGVEQTLDREALRIIECMPRWEAGSIAGVKVPTFYLLPIAFRR